MPAAFLPSPYKGAWHIGPLTLHGYALCVVLGVVVAIWVTERGYRAIGGRAWLVVDMAIVVVPAGLAGAVLYRVITDFRFYFGPGRDWVDLFRITDGGLGLPGAAVAALAAAWLWCRRQGVSIGPVLSAAAPGLALGGAIAVLGNWFGQSLYGTPSTWPWAVEIAPGHRAPGYQSFGTFQPLFLYDFAWDVLIWLLLRHATRRLALTGDRALALCAGLYAAGWLGSQELRPGAAAHAAPITITLLAVIVGATVYLYLTRARRGPQALVPGARGRPARRVTSRTAG